MASPSTDDAGEKGTLTTSHIYGCEAPGCSEIAAARQVWKSGYGWVYRYLCDGHSGRKVSCRKCGQSIEGDGFGSPETGWEHPFTCPDSDSRGTEP